ncbi:MAG: YetF domain-containing protein, partial [Nocardioidaceae bacterium]
IIGPDNSLLGGLIGAVVLIAFNALVVRASVRSGWVANMIEGSATVLARNGVWIDGALRQVGLRRSDAEAAVRRQNANSISEVEEVSLEPGGALLTTLKADFQSATRGDVERLLGVVRSFDEGRLAAIEEKLDRLLARRAEEG